jgi:hypothetical protein
MNNGVLLFAIDMEDAMAECAVLDLNFSKTVWIRGIEYMPGVDLTEWEVIKTAAYILREGENHV